MEKGPVLCFLAPSESCLHPDRFFLNMALNKQCRFLGRFSLYITCLVLCLLPLSAEGARKKKILVLHSYHQGLEWTDSITSGIQSVFKPLDNSYEIYYEYLDAKRNSGDDYDKKLKELFIEKMKNTRFEAVIIADNNALDFIEKSYEFLNGRPPIVFCGINHFQADLIETLPFVTGVTEETDIAANFDLMLRLHPERKRIVVILDRTPTGQALKKPLDEAIEGVRHRVKIDILQDFTLAEAASFVAELDAEDMILLLTFNRDRENNYISYAEGIALLTAASAVPIYGPWDFYLGKGIVGGMITTGYHQGEVAARLTLRVLRGENPRHMPIVTDSGNRVTVDFNRLQAFGIDPGQLPDGSLIVNRPPGFYEKYHRLFFICSLVAVLMLGYCWWRLLMQKRERTRLVEMNAALDLLVAQKTARLEATNQALQKIAITDDLTGIHNRGYLLKALARGIETVDRQGGDLSVILADLDNFKWINDTFGHNFGDKVLKQVSDTLGLTLREKDLAGRYGGEEFLLILPDADLGKSILIADRVRQNIASCRWERDDFQATISGGVVQYAGESVEELLKRADELLYQAKALGRNRMEHLKLPRAGISLNYSEGILPGPVKVHNDGGAVVAGRVGAVEPREGFEEVVEKFQMVAPVRQQLVLQALRPEQLPFGAGGFADAVCIEQQPVVFFKAE
jgi:diguanylate cyclase (GGDEF)-like protein